MKGNDFMSWVLRSPLHGMLSDGIMLLTVTGRKTGKKYTTPVGYYHEGGYLWVITSRDRKWWRNLQGGAEVSLLLKRKPVTAFAELELDAKAVETRMYEYLRHVPQSAKPMGIRMEKGNANADDVIRTASGRLFIRLKLN
ncbi:MAG: nitroreductase family deazaflavin-dependent oxidoreductase [Anaerolineales bacterium]|nr:nitroreductase family deazaflavin-dependent oxidoreductase [Anaerolineales bacterium]